MAAITLAITAWYALQAWTLAEVVGLKVRVAEINTKLTDHIERTAYR